ncbi:hypothetical protein C9374_013429 [Naegleria lovaniensis]|uniref:Zn(2)-C6 fungal-type domain-containing protein n=1 Tax=Naegleria lovaniensis TaxID=51637 RepID=A0AA88KQN1_NAELO|nr:uncharacterized protein C9374_013429 [Naegleria lovaniensis]KAG2391944.1 hypothetical protein C9374_013429 [Naegleria lovaniensis]
MRLESGYNQESEIPERFIYKDDKDNSLCCYITNFEFVDLKTKEMKDPDYINKVSSMCLFGNLVEPNSRTTSSGLDLGRFFVKVVNISQWAFAYESDCNGLWIESSKYWYKLLQPSTEYQPMYAPFERRCNLWFFLRKYLSGWVDELDELKESDSEFEQKRKSLTLDKVIEELKKNNFTEADLINNARFIIDKINEDENEFALDDTNAALLPPFMSELLDRANNGPVITDEVSTYDSDDYEDFKIVIDDEEDSEEDVEEDSEYLQAIEESDETDNEDETFEPATKKKKPLKSDQQLNSNGKSKKKKVNNQERSKKKNQDDSGSEREEESTKRKKTRKQRFSTEYKPPSWLPTMDSLLSTEFTPDLFRLLTTKYEDGVEPTQCRECYKRRVACTKERPLCGNCLEAGTRCNYPLLLDCTPCFHCSMIGRKVCDRGRPICSNCKERGTECFYPVSKDRFTHIAEKRIQQARRKYAQEHPTEQPEYEIESNNIDYWKMQAELEKEEAAKLRIKVDELTKELEKYHNPQAEGDESMNNTS